MLGPIFALFIEDFIIGGNEAVAGIAAGIYLFSRSFLQVPIAYMVDKIRGEKDDFWMLFIFSILTSLTPIAYLFITTPGQLYVIQFILGLFTAFTFPAYMAIFSHHIDKNKEGTEWGIYYALTDTASAFLAVIGGYLASYEGFGRLIILSSVFTFLGALLLWPIKPYLKLAKTGKK